MKVLTIIETALTVLLIALVSALKVAGFRLHALHSSSRAHDDAFHSGFGSVLSIVWYAVLFSWVVFTVIYLLVLFMHCAAWFLRTLGADNKDEVAQRARSSEPPPA